MSNFVEEKAGGLRKKLDKSFKIRKDLGYRIWNKLWYDCQNDTYSPINLRVIGELKKEFSSL